jgi:hypothetical protein
MTEYCYADFHLYAECHMLALNTECCYAECHYAECRNAECHYTDCRGTSLTTVITTSIYATDFAYVKLTLTYK